MRQAVILAGGKGTRLMPFSASFPKPLVPLGDKPVLEILVRRLKSSGFDRLVLAVGHLAHLIEAYFGDGSEYGVEITYSREQSPLGTAGPLAMVENLDENFLVLNGDLLTDLDFSMLAKTHSDSGSVITVARYRRVHKVEFGVLELGTGGIITGYNEKPVMDYDVSMGAYAFSRNAVTRYMEKGARADLPELVLKVVGMGGLVDSWLHEGFWLDIGRPEDYATAQKMFENRPDVFLDASVHAPVEER